MSEIIQVSSTTETTDNVTTLSNPSSVIQELKTTSEESGGKSTVFKNCITSDDVSVSGVLEDEHCLESYEPQLLLQSSTASNPVRETSQGNNKDELVMLDGNLSNIDTIQLEKKTNEEYKHENSTSSCIEHHIVGIEDDQTHILSENYKVEDIKISHEDDSNEVEQNVIKIDKNDVKMLSANDLLDNSNQNVPMCKSPLSKSAENIIICQYSSDPVSSLSVENIDAEKILADFKSQKNKVAHTQKVIDNQQNVIDSKYTKLPKEILNQDIGNIVKNVHGIFSSVSGSLKNAYNYNITQKNTQKLTAPKVVTSTKLMNEIFEETAESLTEEVNTNIENLTGTIKPSSPEQNLEQLVSDESNMNTEIQETELLKEKLKKQADELMIKEQAIKDMEGKINILRRRTEQAERDKDAAVMRYATSECAVIEARKAADTATKAERAAAAEMELLQNKIKGAVREKQRICQMYDDKCHELSNSEREISKLREDVKELEGRLKWTQSKLRMEMDAYKECSERAEKLSAQVSELETMKDAAVVNANGAVKARQLESELKESQAALILCRHERDELDRRAREITIQFDTCKRERDDARQSLETATAEVSRLRESNVRLEEEAAELAALRAQAALADTLASQVHSLSARLEAVEEAALRESARAETCARREAAALTHAATLTQHHLHQAQDNTDTHNKIQALTADNASLRERVTSLVAEVTSLQTSLRDEAERRNRENRVLARKVAELTEELEDCKKNLEWEKGENEVLKKKHANAIKELNRELQRALKRCEQLEVKITQNEPDHSRAGSVSSLSSTEGGSVTSASNHNEDRLIITNGHHEGALPDVQVKEPDRQALIERIVSLQRAAARRSERCDFLEEHTRQLTKELRNKTRLLRQMLLAAPAGSVSDSKRDENKAEIARLGGSAMAALWGGPRDGLTLDLSLEINSRLQALLEDTMLKNITLKENMDTLGKEIERLKSQDCNTGNS